MKNKIENDIELNHSDGIFQAIMDVPYSEWNKPNRENWTYSDMLDWTNSTYGAVIRTVVQIGTMNYQINNGGIHQYL